MQDPVEGRGMAARRWDMKAGRRQQPPWVNVIQTLWVSEAPSGSLPLERRTNLGGTSSMAERQIKKENRNVNRMV